MRSITSRSKPFLKWAGGKTQLLPTIDFYLPQDFNKEKDITYIEPFVGGGAMLFYMLITYPQIKKAIINDINSHLITTYRVIKEKPFVLIESLKAIESEYKSLKTIEEQKSYFLDVRNRFNQGNLTDIEESSYMIFLNRTCFNGLYRENSKGHFNVPFGKYENPTICDESLIIGDSAILQKVEILNGDYSQTFDYVDGYTFFYFDPPYRPLDATSSFNSYVKEDFDDLEQVRLRDFYSDISNEGHKGVLSNSDCKGRNENDDFFDDLYKDFIIERVYAKRHINANPAKRGALTELLIRNYKEYQGKQHFLF